MPVAALKARIQLTPLALPADVSVYQVAIGSEDSTAASSSPEELLELLSPTERDKAQLFIRPGLRERYLYTRAALRVLLGEQLNQSPQALRIAETDQGRPYLPEANLDFNLSHSGDLALIAMGAATRRIGIDIERIKALRDLDQLAERVLTPTELQDLHSTGSTLDPVAKTAIFYRYWCCKEAYLKALGTGLQTDMKHIELALDGTAGHRYLKAPGPEPTLSLEFTPDTEHRAALVLLDSAH